MAKSYIPKFIMNYMIFNKIIKGINNVIVDFKDADSANKAKPAGCNGLFKHVLKDIAPQSQAEFTPNTVT